jgi:acyl-CoA synthetase (AMP-forming)/AMP-acid ligase II
MPTADPVNVAWRLRQTAEANPHGLGVAEPLKKWIEGKRQYNRVSFQELDDDSTLLAAGLHAAGAKPGTRMALMVRPGIDFISCVFAMLKAGVVMVLIDPGMGRKNMLKCLEEVQPEGFVAIPLAHAMRVLMKRRFPKAKINVTVGRRWFWGGWTIKQLRNRKLDNWQLPQTLATDPAAIIFTTGSTGPPKGVLYRHGNFYHQVTEIQARYDIQPGETDLPGFPLFALFNCAMGVSTVIPDMDPTRPAEVNPRNIIDPVADFEISQAFGSPALWNTVSRYCEANEVTMPTLKRVLSAGAPVPPHVIQRVRNSIAPDGDIHTPYGATESLPVASISGSEVLGETAAQTKIGKGVCVGAKFPGIQWRVINIDDGPIEKLVDAKEVARGQIGELMVQGDVVTWQYVTRTDANPLHKIYDDEKVWHRMGDVGYLDDQDRFWFCGRKAHRIRAAEGDMFTIPCEAIFNEHQHVYRSALVGVGEIGKEKPVLIAEPWPEHRPQNESEKQILQNELLELAQSNPLTAAIETILIHKSLPVDIRHNSKIFREQLKTWATSEFTTPKT